MTTSLRITHTHARGTLIEGTTRGDGTSQILKACGWRYSRAVGWYVPRSRDAGVSEPSLTRTVEQLRSAGHDVAVTIDDDPRSTDEIERDRTQRLTARAARLRNGADRQQEIADHAENTSSSLAANWPLGQPLVSNSAHRHHTRRLRADDRERQELERAAIAEARARAAEGELRARDLPGQVRARIERLSAAQRRLERSLAGFTGRIDGIVHPPLDGDRKRAAVQELEHTLEQLAYWQQVRLARDAAREDVEYGPGVVHTGDEVLVNETWYEVLRANVKTVTLDRQNGTRGGVAWTKVRGHRATGQRPLA